VEVSVGLCRPNIGIAPARHPVDPEKSNRVLGFLALITGLCQSYRVLVAPSKVIRPPTNRPFIKKYYAPLGRCRVRHHNSLGMTGSEQ